MKNKKIAQYLKEKNIRHDFNPEFIYMTSKTLNFKLWDIKQSWMSFLRTFKELIK